jgi:hypothetical protein
MTIRYAVVCSCGFARITMSDILAKNWHEHHASEPGHRAHLVARRPKRPELHTDLKREA